MSRINERLGLKPAGTRHAVFGRLSGVRCPTCSAYYVIAGEGKRAGWWSCAYGCGSWRPTDDEILAYNARVRAQDRI
jgi:hypothetical protein